MTGDAKAPGRIRVGQASVHISRESGCLHAHDLESYGDPGDLLAVLRRVQILGQEEPIYIYVSLSNPKAVKLMKLYKKLGAERDGVMLKVGGR